MSQKIIRNSFVCRRCGAWVESRECHEYSSCKCGNATDGGRFYIRRLGKPEDMIDTSIVIKDNPERKESMLKKLIRKIAREEAIKVADEVFLSYVEVEKLKETFKVKNNKKTK